MPAFVWLSVLLWFWLWSAGHQLAAPCRLIHGKALCNNCHLTAVPNHLPGETVEIFLNQNLLSRLEKGCLSKYNFLQTFSCASNQLGSVEESVFLEAPLLENLNLANNELHHDHKQVARSFAFLAKLKALDLSGNRLSDVMVSRIVQNLSSLEYLSLTGNAMLRLDESTFRNLRNLKELDLERNVLFEIDGAFDQMKKLQRLNLAFNCLPCLVQFEMTQLLVLNASHNSLEWFISNQNLTEKFQLEALDLSDNNLLFFPFLPLKNRLRTLVLSNNRVDFYQHVANNTNSNWTTSVEYYNLGKRIDNITMELWSEGLHGDLSSVEFLDLSENRISIFPEHFLQQMPRLCWLRLTGNCLESFSLTSEVLPETLQDLDLSRNRLSRLTASRQTTSHLNHLTRLNLSTNYLQNLPHPVFSHLPHLGTLDVSQNPLDQRHWPSSVLWAKAASLKQLHLSGCSLRHLPSSAFKSTRLTHLELANNPHLELKAEALDSLHDTLQHLGLSNTGLQNFDFSPYINLKFLNISKNSMPELPESLLALNLNILDLRNNNLKTIKSKHATLLAERMQSIYIHGNAFNCCLLEWYQPLRQNQARVVDLSEVTCLDRNFNRHNVTRFDSGHCSSVESVLWYVLLFVTVVVSIIGISVIYLLTFRPRTWPRAIKEKCWRPMPY